MSEEVLYEVRERAAWITLNRPQSLNALNEAMRSALKAQLERAEADSQARVVVLTGAGDRAFCAGGDLKEMAHDRLQIPPSDFVPQPGRTMAMTKPFVVAVNGLAYGGGFLLVQCADLVVAAQTAKFAVSEAKVGRGSPWAASLPWLLAPRHAMEILLTGNSISAERAYEIGLVNRVVPLEQLAEATTQLVSSISENAPLSVRAAKRMVYAAAEVGRTTAFQESERIWQSVYLSRDAQEGPLAFAEGRVPKWEGR